MSEGISNIANQKSEVFLNNKTLSSTGKNSNGSDRSKKMKIYAVYNPDSNPNFYLHNKLNWYKNFDWAPHIIEKIILRSIVFFVIKTLSSNRNR